MMVEFRGARMEITDEGEKKYEDRGPIWLETRAVIGFYAHTLLTEQHRILVMEEIEEIQQKLARGVTRENNGVREMLAEMRLG